MVPPWVWWVVLGFNALAWVAFAWDKWRARRGGRRVPEARLLLLLWLGCLGAWCGMRMFRHKTRKTSFLWRAILLTVLNPLWWLVWRQLRGWLG
ncbi:MAG: DUF1294 domain-containing protein [Planctomycetota bacterium]